MMRFRSLWMMTKKLISNSSGLSISPKNGNDLDLESVRERQIKLELYCTITS